jgi:hypothetical protein
VCDAERSLESLARLLEIHRRATHERCLLRTLEPRRGDGRLLWCRGPRASCTSRRQDREGDAPLQIRRTHGFNVDGKRRRSPPPHRLLALTTPALALTLRERKKRARPEPKAREESRFSRSVAGLGHGPRVHSLQQDQATRRLRRPAVVVNSCSSRAPYHHAASDIAIVSPCKTAIGTSPWMAGVFVQIM